MSNLTKPFFAKDKDLQRNLAQAESAGAREMRVADPGDFSVGDRAFISEADGSELEYLGELVSIGADRVEVSRGLAAAKSATALLWRAGSFHQWSAMASAPLERRWRQGVATERSVGGLLWPVRTADPFREDVLRFRGVLRAEFDAFRSWLEAQTRGGLEAFTWVNSEFEIAGVRLLDCDFVQSERQPKTVDVTLSMGIETEGGYA